MGLSAGHERTEEVQNNFSLKKGEQIDQGIVEFLGVI